MIVVRILEAGEAFDAGDDGVAPEARLAKLDEIGPGGPFLLRVQGEQRAAILRAVIRTLIVERGRIGDNREEDEQQRAVDRKGVVEGKSVSVRVDLGGRRIITKNKAK